MGVSHDHEKKKGDFFMKIFIQGKLTNLKKETMKKVKKKKLQGEMKKLREELKDKDFIKFINIADFRVFIRKKIPFERVLDKTIDTTYKKERIKLNIDGCKAEIVDSHHFFNIDLIDFYILEKGFIDPRSATIGIIRDLGVEGIFNDENTTVAQLIEKEIYDKKKKIMQSKKVSKKEKEIYAAVTECMQRKIRLDYFVISSSLIESRLSGKYSKQLIHYYINSLHEKGFLIKSKAVYRENKIFILSENEEAYEAEINLYESFAYLKEDVNSRAYKHNELMIIHLK